MASDNGAEIYSLCPYNNNGDLYRDVYMLLLLLHLHVCTDSSGVEFEIFRKLGGN